MQHKGQKTKEKKAKEGKTLRTFVRSRTRAGGGQLRDTGKARSARKAWEAAYDTHCGKYASGGSVEMLEDLLWANVACIGV